MGRAPWLVLRQAEHALGEDVAKNLGGPGADPAAAGQQLVELPLAVVRRPRGAVGDLRVRSDDLRGDVRQLLIELAPEELRGRALGPGRAAAQDLREAPVAVELERLLADPEGGQLLTQDWIFAPALLLRETHQAVQRVAQRNVPDERQQVALVRERRDRDRPALVGLADEMLDWHAHVVEEDFIELSFAGDLPERPHRDAR